MNSDQIVNALVKQGIGCQSRLYRLFVESLNVPQDTIRKIELTYFALSVLTFILLRFLKSESKSQILDEFSLSLIQASIESSETNLTINQIVSEYQKRYQEYNVMLVDVFSEKEPNPNITLLMHFYERVVSNSAKDAMLDIALASPEIHQYVVMNLDFVRTKL